MRLISILIHKITQLDAVIIIKVDKMRVSEKSRVLGEVDLDIIGHRGIHFLNAKQMFCYKLDDGFINGVSLQYFIINYMIKNAQATQS